MEVFSMARELTTIALEKIKPGSKRKEIPDGRVGGLYFVIQPSGKRSWAFRYRHGGQSRKLTLGAYPATSLKSAREKVADAKNATGQGRDPAAEKKASRADATAQAGDLVEAVTTRFVAQHAKRKLKAATAAEVDRLLNKEIVTPWRGRRLSQIGRADIHTLLDGIVERGSPVAANRTLAWLRRLCSWAVERGLIEASPCAGINTPATETARDRVLSDVELAAVWRAVGSQDEPLRRSLSF
jgi:Arm domain-containing DNA-binding protein/integrase-like protein